MWSCPIGRAPSSVSRSEIASARVGVSLVVMSDSLSVWVAMSGLVVKCFAGWVSPVGDTLILSW